MFTDRDIEVFCPTLCDTEAYHATVEHIASVTGLAEPDAATIRNEVIGAWLPELRKKHRDKRRTVNRTYLDGVPLGPTRFGQMALTRTKKCCTESCCLRRLKSVCARKGTFRATSRCQTTQVLD